MKAKLTEIDSIYRGVPIIRIPNKDYNDSFRDHFVYVSGDIFPDIIEFYKRTNSVRPQIKGLFQMEIGIILTAEGMDPQIIRDAIDKKLAEFPFITL